METFSAQFPYSPLQPLESIRIAILEPGEFRDPIRCRLEHVELSTKPKYEALSYHWGDPLVTVPIELEWRTFPITTNLDCALRYLRRSSEPRALWVDAICINQRDDAERSYQVQRMGRIYKSAFKVVMWVGEEGVSQFSYHSVVPTEMIFGFIKDLYHDKEIEADLAGSGFSPQDWMLSLTDFVNKPYWSRLWIVQEAATNAITELVCGHQAIPLFVFRFGFDCVGPSLDMLQVGAETFQYQCRHFQALYNCFEEYRQWKYLGPGHALAIADRLVRILFALSGEFESRDPKDRLFAILSFVGDHEMISGLGLDVDYRKDASKIFQELAIFLLQQRGNLDILTHIDASDQDIGFAQIPSWVPTWGNSPYCTLRRIAESRSENNSSSLRFSADKDVLFLQGIVFDAVLLAADETSPDSVSNN